MRAVLTFLLLFTLVLPLASQAVILKIATLAPDGGSWMMQMRNGAKEIQQKTNNRVKFKFYPGGIMGNEKSVLRKMRIGQLQGAALTTSGLARISPDSQMYSLPLRFRSFSEVDYVREHMDDQIIKSLDKKGYISFGLAEGGFSYLMSQTPIYRASDLRKQKVWAPEGDVISMTLLDKLGISPVPLPLTDVLTGLQTSLITTVGSTPTFTLALQWHSKLKYVNSMPLFYSSGSVVISKKAFMKIKPEDQKIVRDIMTRTFKILNKRSREDNIKAKQALIKQGIKYINPSAEDKKELRAAADKAIQTLIKDKVYSKAMLKAIDTHLATYRKKHPVTATGN
ncbi:MAG: TRAP transporter substrate-binding protein [Gammaproteobacteria bacterium]|nr:MAG: TRAP transporter substrate-binding protein [Gammaproteobacteria bacterium]